MIQAKKMRAVKMAGRPTVAYTLETTEIRPTESLRVPRLHL